MKRKFVKFAALCAAATLSLTLAPYASGADVGDGQLGCNIGEICLSKDNPGSNHQRHFYNSGYTDGNWTNVDTGVNTGIAVRNSASSVWNRDTECPIFLDDLAAPVKRRVLIYRNSTFEYVGLAMDDRNDYLYRCY